MKIILSANTQDITATANTEINKNIMSYSFRLLERKPTIYLRFIKLILVLLFLIQAGKLSAQCGGTWSGGSNLTFGCLTNARFIGSANTINQSQDAGCLSNPIYTANQTATYTFTAPVSSFKINFSAFSSTPNCSKMELKINGVHYDLNNATYAQQCSSVGYTEFTTDANGYITGSSTAVNATNVQATIIISGVNASTVTISSNDGNGSLYSTPFACTACIAGSTAPVLSATTLIPSNCPTGTVNLNSIVTSTPPAGTTLRWYANNTATGSPLTTPTASTAGTYYAFYYDTTNNCASPASSAVTVGACCAVIAPISN